MLIIGDWLLKFQPDYDQPANRFRRYEMVLGACVCRSQRVIMID
jgi:hypothetical protein